MLIPQPLTVTTGLALPQDCSTTFRLFTGLGSRFAQEEVSDSSFSHETVLLQEALSYLNPSPGKVIVDGTLGGGGHTEAILKAGANVIAFDQDPAARAAAQMRLSPYADQLKVIPKNFAEVESELAEVAPEGVDGFLLDLGVSSPQLDIPERGFSFRQDGPLDMRMDPSAELSAATIVNEWDEVDIANLIFNYGEERKSRKIANAIVRRRAEAPFSTTLDLARVVSNCVPKIGKQHPATRTFQGLRIAVNDELGVLKEALESSSRILKPGGRLVVISFHSLEDRIVKQYLKETSAPEVDRKEWPAPRPNPRYFYQNLTRKPMIPGSEEISRNTRARSSKLRAVERIPSL